MSAVMLHDAQRTETLAIRVQNALREQVLTGQIPPGQRLTEWALVESLGASRTPIRSALASLEREGLLSRLRSGGYAVREFSAKDIADSIELRGMLEGWAARRAAQNQPTAARMEPARQALHAIDEVLGRAKLRDEDFGLYVRHNQAFHAWLSEVCDAPVIQQEIRRASSLPFASPSGFVAIQAATPHSHQLLRMAQDQHWQIVEAVQEGDAGRAEALAREHARIARRNLQRVVSADGYLVTDALQAGAATFDSTSLVGDTDVYS
ncbi:MAG: GntR family transcriptional regulator [Burkholderiaceae bacterium]